jgi:exosome complex component RRP42
MSDAAKIVTTVTTRRISELLAQDQRLDGRGLLDYREMTVEVGTIDKASGSALVNLGRTKVLTGIKIETGTPYPDTPESGVLIVNVELVPLASPTFEPGPPREGAIELARVVDRGLRESKALDLAKLCITPGKKVFLVFVDIYVLDHDGNLFDASALASIAALMNATMKDYTVSKSGTVKFKDKDVALPLQHYPVEVTVGKIQDKLLVDPSLDEEGALDAQITIAVDQNGDVCAVQKRGIGTFTIDEVLQAVDIVQVKAEEIRTTVLGALISESKKAKKKK